MLQMGWPLQPCAAWSERIPSTLSTAARFRLHLSARSSYFPWDATSVLVVQDVRTDKKSERRIVYKCKFIIVSSSSRSSSMQQHIGTICYSHVNMQCHVDGLVHVDMSARSRLVGNIVLSTIQVHV
jgi:hypothetical protein